MNIRLLAAGLALILWACSPQREEKRETLRLNLSQEGRVELTGLPSSGLEAVEWRERIVVFVGDSLPEGDLVNYPVVGRFIQEEGKVVFIPLFPWKEGLTYFAQADLSGLGVREEKPVLALHFNIPVSEHTPTRLLTAYPSADTLPANLLRVYLHFSAPMRREGVYEFISLENQQGETLENSFVELAPPLWDREGRRLTLLFHPGRIKQGLDFHDRMGPPLDRGITYVLRVAAAMPDAHGNPLENPFQKVFVARENDRLQPDPGSWKMDLPAAGSADSLSLIFPEALDHALMKRMLYLHGPDKRIVEGEVHTAQHEKQWIFYPQKKWVKGAYSVQINPKLEDLAGNNLLKVFDRNMEEEESESAPVQSLAFEIR